MSAISSWLPVPSSTGWMIGRKSEIRETRRTVGSAAGSDGGAAVGASAAGASLAAGGAEADGAVAWQAANTSANTAKIAGKRARM